MTQVRLRDPFVNSNPNQSKLRQYEKLYTDLRKQIIAEDKSISNKQTTKLKEFIKQLHDIKNKVQLVRNQCKPKNAKLKQEIDLLESKLQGFQIGAKSQQMEANFKAKIAEQENTFINNCQKRVQIAESIDYKKLQNIDIEERKSLANEVFKWMLVAIYTEPENKYYWPNFKEEVIEKKEGCQDLRQRLGKFDAYHAKEQQRVKTIKFIELFEKIRVCAEFNDCSAEIQKIYEIAKLFLNCSDIGRKVRQYEKENEEYRKLNLKDDEALVQKRKECDALVEKYRLGELYLSQLTKIDNAFTIKLQKYYREVQLAESYIAQISNITASKLNFVQSVQPKSEMQKRENCECSIF